MDENLIIGLALATLSLEYFLMRYHEFENINGVKYRVTKIPFIWSGTSMTIWKKKL